LRQVVERKRSRRKNTKVVGKQKKTSFPIRKVTADGSFFQFVLHRPTERTRVSLRGSSPEGKRAIGVRREKLVSGGWEINVSGLLRKEKDHKKRNTVAGEGPRFCGEEAGEEESVGGRENMKAGQAQGGKWLLKDSMWEVHFKKREEEILIKTKIPQSLEGEGNMTSRTIRSGGVNYRPANSPGTWKGGKKPSSTTFAGGAVEISQRKMPVRSVALMNDGV